MLPRRCPLILTLLILSACGNGEREITPTPAPTLETVAGPIQPVVRPPGLDPDKVALGRLLFHDPRLSGNGTVSCASCHAIANYGAESRRTSIGIGGQVGPVNAPTVLNSGFNVRQFWDGRAADLVEQAGGPIENPAEMGAKLPEVIERLRQDPAIAALSKRAFGRPLDGSALKEAIAEYERGLVTVDAPFDRFLRGDAGAIPDGAKRGWRLFRDMGCVSCHQGGNVGGNMFATFGVMGDYFAGRPLEKGDYGRFNATGREEDRFRFKVPSLRNVEKTAPYFHDGRAETLEQAVETMARIQLGLELDASERDDLVAFLKSLTGRLPE